MSNASTSKTPMGVQIVDNLLDGGVPKGSSVLIRAHPLADPSTMAIQFLHNHLKNGGIGLFFVNNKSPLSVLEESAMLGMNLKDFKTQGQLYFIDAYSSLFGLRSDEAYSVDELTPRVCPRLFLNRYSECSKKASPSWFIDSLKHVH
jgi:KaiC/GvpD/RAD55 family RecA-like ATPase